MSFLKRTVLSLKKRWIRNLAILLLFTAIFSVLMGSVMIYTSSQKNIAQTEKGTVGALSFYGGVKTGQQGNILSWFETPMEDAQKMVDSPYVETYNLSSEPMSNGVVGEGTELYVRNPDLAQAYQDSWSDEQLELFGKEYIYGVTNSEMCEAFSAYGFQLVEGEPITPEDAGGDCLLISQEYAKQNGLKLGDEITFHGSSMRFGEIASLQHTFTVTGIFSLPSQEGKSYQFPTEDPANIVFGEAHTVIEWLEKDGVTWVSVYLRDPREVESYLTSLASQIDLRGFLDRFSGEDGLTIGDIDPSKGELEQDFTQTEEGYEEWAAHRWYAIQWDRDWFEMIAGPVQSLGDLSLYLALGLLLGAAVILILVCIWNVRGRKREFGLLLSLGESKWKIAFQALLETFLPIFAALLMGILVSAYVTGPMLETSAQQMLSSSAEEAQEENRRETMENNVYEQADLLVVALQTRMNGGVLATSRITYEMEALTITVYTSLILVATLLVLCVELALVLRLKPAEILRQNK